MSGTMSRCDGFMSFPLAAEKRTTSLRGFESFQFTISTEFPTTRTARIYLSIYVRW